MMVVNTQLTANAISSEDFLAAARTIPANHAERTYLNQDWIKPATLLDWSRQGLANADDYGLSNAVTYAKRAACCRIDRLIRNYHLRRLSRAPFPAKIEALENVGLSVPSVVHELIIAPRNELEHEYALADADTARRAVDIATLFLVATNDVDGNESIIAINMNMLYTSGSKDGERKATFDGWSGGTMLFMDIFADPHTAKLVDGENGEVQYTAMSDFNSRQAAQLSALLHSHYSLTNRGSSCTGTFFYTELKRLAGF